MKGNYRLPGTMGEGPTLVAGGGSSTGAGTVEDDDPIILTFEVSSSQGEKAILDGPRVVFPSVGSNRSGLRTLKISELQEAGALSPVSLVTTELRYGIRLGAKNNTRTKSRT